METTSPPSSIDNDSSPTPLRDVGPSPALPHPSDLSFATASVAAVGAASPDAAVVPLVGAADFPKCRVGIDVSTEKAAQPRLSLHPSDQSVVNVIVVTVGAESYEAAVVALLGAVDLPKYLDALA